MSSSPSTPSTAEAPVRQWFGRLATVPLGRLVVLAALLMLVSLAALVALTQRQAEQAVRDQAYDVAETSAGVSAQAISSELEGLRALVDAYAQRRALARAIHSGVRGGMRRHLQELSTARPGISSAAAMGLDGRVLDVIPPTPSIIGRSFASRDYYRGLTRTGRTYVSEAFVGAASGRPTVVSAAGYVRHSGRPVGILVAASSAGFIQSSSERLARAGGIRLIVTDQRGAVVVGPRTPTGELSSRRDDPVVRAALAGRGGVVERTRGERRVLVGYAPVPDVGWTVTAELDEAAVLAGVERLRTTQLALGAPLLIGLLAGLGLLVATLRRRTRAESRLRRSESSARAIVETAPEAFVALATDGTIRGWNPAAARLFGWNSDEAIGRMLAETIALSRSDGTALEPGDLASLPRGTAVVAGHRDGRSVAVELAVAARAHEDGTLNVFIRDVSERVVAERVTRAQVGVARALAESAGVDDAMPAILAGLGGPLEWSIGLFWTLDASAGRLRCASLWQREGVDTTAFADASCGVALARGEGLPGRAWERDEVVFADVSGDGISSREPSAQRAGLHGGISLPVRGADGLYGVMEFCSERVSEGDPTLVALVTGAAEQIGRFFERRRAEERVHTSETRLRAILDNTPAVVSLRDADGRHVLVNRAFERLLGLPAEDVVGRTPEAVYPEPLGQAIRDGDREVLRTGLPLEVEEEAVMADGERHTLLSLKFPLTDTEGRSSGVCSISTDITERKLSEGALQAAHQKAVEASRLKSEFVANMSHELRTPLNGVIGMTGLLLGTDLDEEQAEYADMAARAGESLLAVISDILDFSKMEAGRLELDDLDFDIRQVVEDACAIVTEKAFAKGLELLSSVESDVQPAVRGDEARLRQVLINLLSNAVKFTDGGEVVARVSTAESGAMRFEIRDTGLGLDGDQQARLWDAFTQADSSTTRTYGGTGLGLTISRQLVERMGGAIGVESAVGRGSTFWFEVPLAPASRPALDEEYETTALAGRRVLVVDDNATNRSILRGQLSAWDIGVVAVADGPAALEALTDAAGARKPFDLAILDFHMPGMNGLALAYAIRRLPGVMGIPLVILTSSGSDRVAAREAGVRIYLTKPVRHDRLRRALVEALNGGPASATAARADIPTASAPRHARLLVAEDNHVNQLVARATFERLGFGVDIAVDGDEAVAKWSSGAYEAVFMDCQMPVVDGYAATRRIRAAEEEGDGSTRTPIIAMTANVMDGDRERCLAAGMDDYLAKPLERLELHRALTRWVGDGNAPAPDPSPIAERPASGNGVFDAQAGRDLRDQFRPEVLRRLVEIFVEQTPTLVGLIATAMHEHDPEALWPAAHRLKGSCRAVGAVVMAECCEELERRGRAGRITGSETLVGRLQAAYEPTVTAMRAALSPTA